MLIGDSDEALALHAQAIAALEGGDRDEALALMTRACASPFAPIAFHAHHAEMLRQAGLLAEAEVAVRSVIERDPASAQAWNT